MGGTAMRERKREREERERGREGAERVGRERGERERERSGRAARVGELGRLPTFIQANCIIPILIHVSRGFRVRGGEGKRSIFMAGRFRRMKTILAYITDSRNRSASCNRIRNKAYLGLRQKLFVL